MRWIALLSLCLAWATARADDWQVKRDPFDPAVIRRYEAILARDPHDRFAFDRLVGMYRRYRTVDQLERAYRARLDASPGDWATLVVLARLPRDDRAATTALWQRAVAARPDDARGWLALGDLATDPRTARDAFRNAVAHAGSPRDRRRALTKLIGAARSAGDAATVDAAYGELIALAPRDGGLWLDRGDAQLAAKQPAAALESYGHAERLLAADPERRLTARMSGGVALERLGRVDDAIAAWTRALDDTPRGSYLRRELVTRIVDAERKRRRLADAIAKLEQRWPERRRGYYEWDLLGDLYAERHDDARALAAYRRAVAKAPTEVETQRELIRLLDRLHPEEALGQHEAAARLAPGDARLQIELAKRYREQAHDDAKAIATLERLARRMHASVAVREMIAELFTEWEDAERALHEYEAVARLEPDEPEHAFVLGDAYWRGGHPLQAVAAWQRLAKIGRLAVQLRLGEVFTLHDLWDDAVGAFSRAIELDPTSAEAWRGRARAHDELGAHASAIRDAARAVALIGTATADAGLRARFQLVRALSNTPPTGGEPLPLATALARWRFAFEHGDNAAGYLLVTHHARIRSHQHHDALVALYRRVPHDDALGMSVARSYANVGEFDRARAVLEGIARRSPKRAQEIAQLVELVEAERRRADDERLREEEGLSPTDAARPDVVDRRHRFGVRSTIGADVRGTSSALLGLGLYRTSRIGRGAAFALRLDWTQRDDEREEVNAFGLAGALVVRVLGTARAELAVELGPRVELRYGSDARSSSWGRAGLAADAGLVLVPRALPATLGVRLQQALTDPVRGSTVLVELGFEVR